MKRFSHRPDCNCAQCSLQGFKPPVNSIPQVMTGSRLIWGFGQDDSDDGDSSDDSESDDSEEEPDEESDDTSESDDSNDSTSSSSFLPSLSLSNLLSTGKQAVQTVSQVEAAVKGGTASKPAVRVATPTAAAATPLFLFLGVAVGAFILMGRKK